MKKGTFVRAPGNYDMEQASDEAGLACMDESLAKQAFADEVDINTIVRRFHLTGEFPEGMHAPTYGDFSDVHDFHSAANAIAQANEAFDAMPAEIRARFGNDPGAFVDFCSDEKNREEMKRFGLIVADKVVAAPAAAPVDPAPSIPAGPEVRTVPS